jgi:hypothetical protein
MVVVTKKGKLFFSAWNAIFQCAYNTSEYPRPSIYEDPLCYNKSATEDMIKAMASLGPYHKYSLENKLQWKAKETCYTNANI